MSKNSSPRPPRRPRSLLRPLIWGPLVCLAVVFVSIGFWRSSLNGTVWVDNGDSSTSIEVEVDGQPLGIIPASEGKAFHLYRGVRHFRAKAADSTRILSDLNGGVKSGGKYIFNPGGVSRFYVHIGGYGRASYAPDEDLPVSEWMDVSEYDFVMTGLPSQIEGVGTRSVVFRRQPGYMTEKEREEAIQKEDRRSRIFTSEADLRAILDATEVDRKATPRTDRAYEKAVPVVIHLGGDMIYAGFGGEEAPKVVFPPVVGGLDIIPGVPPLISHVGDDALSERGALALSRPYSRGEVDSWLGMSALFSHTFEKLGVSSEQQPVLVLVTPMMGRADSDRLRQLLFEILRIPATLVAAGTPMGLFAARQTTGLVVQLETDHGFVGPVHDFLKKDKSGVLLKPPFGLELLSAAGNGKILSGESLHSRMGALLKKRGYDFITQAESETLRDIVDKLCYVALDAEAEGQRGDKIERNYEFPNGQIIRVGSERHQVPEILFRPKLIDSSAPGLPEAIQYSISRAPEGMRQELYGNIVLTGPYSILPGLAERLEKEVIELAPAGTRVKVLAIPEGKYSIWLGGSKVATLPEMNNLWEPGRNR